MFAIWHVMNKCTVVAKRELFYAWPFGLAAWLAGLTFIDRVRGEKARSTLNAVNSRVKLDNIKLWVFPEGTRRNTGELHAFKKGAFHMAIDEQIPILPVVFSSYCSFLNDKMKILNAGNIIITALPPISTANLTKDDLPELMERVHRQMALTLKQTSAEVLSRYKTVKSSPMTVALNTGGSNNTSASTRAATADNTSLKRTKRHAPPAAPATTVTAASLQQHMASGTALATEECQRSVKLGAPALKTTNT